MMLRTLDLSAKFDLPTTETRNDGSTVDLMYPDPKMTPDFQTV